MDVNSTIGHFCENKKFIGKGGFGEVYGPFVWEDKLCAVKRRMFTLKESSEKEKEAGEKWKSLDHRNLITVYNISFEPPALYIIMEYGYGGSLKSILERCTSDLPLDILTDWCIQIAQGMAYLHNRNIVHRDLKSHNIIIMERDNDINLCGKTLKIIDFDQIRESDHTTEMSIAGSYSWMAPEVLDSLLFSKTSDVWSYGVVLWEMLTREVPYKGLSGSAIMFGVLNKTLELKVPASCPEIIKAVLKSCLCYEKNERQPFLCIAELLHHPQSRRVEGSQEGEVEVSSENITDDSGVDCRLTDIPTRITPFGGITHIHSECGSFTNQTAIMAEACPAVKKRLVDEAIERHREFLEERIEPDFGLLDKLLAQGTLSRKEISEVKVRSSLYERNSELLNFILEKQRSDRLIEALQDTHQIHIVNYLNGSGERNPEYGEEWPLTHREVSILDTNHYSLIELLYLSDLLDRLYCAQVITKRQRNFISSKTNSDSKCEALLDILRRRSLRDYRETISCLHHSNQSHIAEVFESGGVIARVHAHLDGPIEGVTSVEDEISTKIADVLSGISIADRSRILELAQFKLIAGKKGQSIVLYIWCETVKELLRLIDFLASGCLKDIIEQLFNHLLTQSQKAAVKDIVMDDEEVERKKAYFKELGHSVVEQDMESEEMEESMTLVDINTAIMRNNNDFFSQHLKLRGVINKLHAADILSDEDTRYIKTLDHVSDKIDEVLNVIRNSTSEAYNTFVSFLRESGQTLVADVAEKGGVVLKIKIIHEPMENSEEIQKQIVEKINQLQDNNVPKIEEVWRFLSQLKRGNMEIVSSQLENRVVIWCWCRSLSALRTFEELSMSDVKQPNLLNGLFNLLLAGILAPTMNSVSLVDHEKKIVCHQHKNIHSKNSFAINERQAVGVAILQTKICLLCRNPNAIVVYELGDLTKPCEEMSLNDVLTPTDMAYSKESNCLYITDEGKASVWKIAFPSPGNKVDLWLDAGAGDPFTLSVTNDGRVVMVKRGPPSCLEIYHPDAQLLLNLVLPSPIVKPNHAVETSKGNFVVAYDEDGGVQSGICQITKEGHLISRFDSKFEPISGVAENVNKRLALLAKAKRIGFNYLAIDEKDQLYVCDSVNGRLAVFDSRLFMLENGKSGLNALHRVHYFKEQMQLFVLYGLQKNLVSILATE